MEPSRVWLSAYVSDIYPTINGLARVNNFAEFLFKREYLQISTINDPKTVAVQVILYPEVFLEYIVRSETFLLFGSREIKYHLDSVFKNDIFVMWHDNNTNVICYYIDQRDIKNCVKTYPAKGAFSIKSEYKPDVIVRVRADEFKYLIDNISDVIVKFEFDGKNLKISDYQFYDTIVIRGRRVNAISRYMLIFLMPVIKFDLSPYVDIGFSTNGELIISVNKISLPRYASSGLEGIPIPIEEDINKYFELEYRVAPYVV